MIVTLCEKKTCQLGEKVSAARYPKEDLHPRGRYALDKFAMVRVQAGSSRSGEEVTLRMKRLRDLQEKKLA